MHPYALVLYRMAEAMCYNDDQDSRLRFEQLEPGMSVVVRLLVVQRKHAVVREYCGVVKSVTSDDGRVFRLKTISGRHRRPLSEPEAREMEVPLHMHEDGMIHVFGDPSDIYGYVLPATKPFVRTDVPAVATYVDRVRSIAQIAA